MPDLEMGLIGIAHRSAYVLQGSTSNVTHLLEGYIAGLNSRRPALFNVYSPCQPEHGIADLRGRLAAWDGGLDAEALQSLCFAVGREHGFEPLRAWFAALYEVLLGASQGPRFGGFIALYGVEETIALIDRALAGELAAS